MKKKNGFTLVELLAVLVILIIILTIAMVVTKKQIERARKNAFLSEALTYANAGYDKYSNDRSHKMYGAIDDDLYHGSVTNHVCFNVQAHLTDKYVKKSDAVYKGSVDVCYGTGCTYTTKVWLTDGESFIDGEEDPSKSVAVKTAFTTEYYNSCGVATTGIGGISTPEAPNVINFPYTGDEQQFLPGKTGLYKIEVWGAQGGSCDFVHGGYGGYSVVETTLYTDQTLYINVGGQGGTCANGKQGGYNGGGTGGCDYNNELGGGGGGLTHVATKSGLLSKPVNRDYVLVVAGGGGGGRNHRGNFSDGASAGGYRVYGVGHKEQAAYYGKGENGCAGSGGGLFGASSDNYSPTVSGGGSGFIGNPSTTNKKMMCFTGCSTSSDAATKTIDTSNVSEQPISEYVKQGDGHARITYIGE